MKIILALTFVLFFQAGCSFIITTAGSFLGNLGADFVEEKMKENEEKKEEPGK